MGGSCARAGGCEEGVGAGCRICAGGGGLYAGSGSVSKGRGGGGKTGVYAIFRSGEEVVAEEQLVEEKECGVEQGPESEVHWEVE